MTPPPLTTDRWARIEAIFHEARNVEAAGRAAWLLARCEGDQTLAAEVQMLLASSALEKKARSEVRVAGPPASRRFGAWQTVRLIAQGGMGAVFEAQRADGQFAQKVALKVLGTHLASGFFVARFLTERQILANLNHPDITRLLDGGITPEGDPFLVMEFVEGEPIDRYCDKRRLAIADRLTIFQRICAAVEYAHRNLVIHRDLKPGNILVTAAGEPKLLDFGTAKLTGAGEGSEVPVTAVAMMTPRYASPEQLRGETVTTLSDVYSLGVVLYELLTGAWPFGDPGSTFAALERAVSGREPAPLRAVVTEEAAGARSSTAAKLAKLLEGDLENIALKAIATSPERRYGSVTQFAEDIDRYLTGRAVLARPQTAAYRVGKFVRRNKALAAAAAALALAIAGGVTATAWQAHVARLAQARAERRFEDVHKLADYLVFDFETALRRLAGSTPLQRQVVERSLEYLDSLAREASGDRKLQLELAEAYQRMGDVLGNPFNQSLGERAKALDAYRKAQQQVQHVLAADPRNGKARQLAANIDVQMGAGRVFAGEADEGIAQVDRGSRALKTLLEESPGDLDLRLALAKAMMFHATQLSQRGGQITASETAGEEYGRAIEVLNDALRRNPQHPRVVQQLAQAEWSLGSLFTSLAPQQAIDHFQKAIAWLGQLPPAEADSLDNRRLRAGISLNLGWSLGQTNAFPQALEAIAEAEKLDAAEAAMDPENTSAAYHLSGIYRSRGIVCGYAKMTDCAIASFESAAAIHQRLIAKQPENTTYRGLRGELLMRIADLLIKQGRVEQATERGREGLAMLTALAEAPKATSTELSQACRFLADTEVKTLRDPKLARAYCEKAAVVSQEKDAVVMEELATARDAMGDRAGAIQAVEKALALLPAPEAGKPKSRQRINLEKTLADWRK